MNMIENHLRGALAELADEIPADGVPPLRLPASRRELGRTRGWLAPLGAAAAILAIAIAVTVLASISRDSTARPRINAAAEDRVPPYYLALTTMRTSSGLDRDTAAIFATGTGALLVPIVPPGKSNANLAAASAAADDRTFALADGVRQSNGTLRVFSFYLARFDPAARKVAVTAIAVPGFPASASLDALALSPDGTKLAIAFEPNARAANPTDNLRVLDLSTGTSRTWTGSRGIITGDIAFQLSLSWAGDNTTLAFSWYGGSHAPADGPLSADSGFRLLDTAKPAGSLIANSRLAVPFVTRNRQAATSAGYVSGHGLLAPDGRSVVTAVTALHGHDAGFARFSTANGRFEREIGRGPYRATASSAPVMVFWVSADGRTLIVYAPPGHPGRIGILSGGHLTLLPRNQRAFPQVSAW